MVKLAVSVEGLTELNFVKEILAPHLKAKGCEVVKPFNMDGDVALSTERTSCRFCTAGTGRT